MDEFKLNRRRFEDLDAGTITTYTVIDASGAKAGADETVKSLDIIEKSVDGTTNALASLSLATAKSGTNMRSTSKMLRQDITSAIEVLKKQISSANTDDKFKIQASTLIGKTEAYEDSRDKRSTNLSVLNKEYTLRERLYNLIIKGSAQEEKAFAREKAAMESASNSINKQTSFFTKLTNAILGNTNATNKNASSAKNGASAWTQFTKSMTGKMVRFRILSGFIRGVGRALYDIYDEAASYQEALNLYTVSLGEYAEQGRVWADSISKPLYLNPQQIMQYTGAMFNLVEGLGVASDAAYIMSTNLTQLSYDMSSYLNIDVESAHEKLQSAITGQSRAVASAGIAMQQASLQELAYSLGIKKSVSTMTQAEKTYLRYIQIMNNTKNMQGDLARTIVTPENAMRVMQTQFKLLARAIGNVFIPIVLKAIPYVMAFTQILTELAQKLAAWTGFKIVDIDYSNLKSASMDMENFGDSVSGTAGKINRSLAAFDDLNVVESKTSGSGGGGIGSDPNILKKLEEYIEGYDMLAGLNTKLSENVEKIKESMKSWIPVIEGVAGAFLLWKGVKAIASIFDFIGALSTGKSALSGFAKMLTKLGGTVSGVVSNAFKNLTKVLGGGSAAISILLGSVITFITTTTTLKDVVYTWTKVQKDLDGSLFASTATLIGLQAALSAVLFAVNPIIGTLAAIAFAISDVNSAIDGHKKALDELSDANIYGNLSISSDEWLESLRNASSEIKGAGDSFDGFKSKMDSLKDSFDEADRNVQLLGIQFHATTNKISEEDAEKFKNSIKSMCDSTYSMIDENANRSLSIWGSSFESMSVLTDDEEKNIVNSIINYGNDQKKELKETQDNITNTYDNAIKNRGYLTDEEYTYIQTQLQKIRDLTKSEMSTTQTELEYMKIQAADGSLKLDKKSYDELKKALETFGEEQNKQTQQTYNEMLNEAKRYHKDHAEDTKTYNNMIKQANATREQNEKETSELIKGYQTDILSNLAKTYTEMDEKTDDTSKLTKEKIRTIFKDFELDDKDLIKTFEKAGTDSAETMVGHLKSEALGEKQAKVLDEAGRGLGKTILSAFNRTPEETIVNSVLTFTSSINSARNLAEEEKIGKNITKGIAKGMADKKTNKSAASTFGSVLLSAVKGALGIKSPSRLFIRNKVGNYITQGIAIGMENELPVFNDITDGMFETISKGVEDNSSKISDLFEIQPTSNLSDNITNEFKIISKDLDAFSNKWTDTMSKVFETDSDMFNSKFGDTEFTKNLKDISYEQLDLNTYNYVKDIPEFVSNVVNESKVSSGNKDNTLLTSALTDALSSIKSDKEPRVTQVYIGNDKVYEGQGKYQDRQTERYGTTYIKV